MAEPFKNFINETVVCGIAQHLALHYPAFEQQAFIEQTLIDFSNLELKARTQRISLNLVTFLPKDFPQAAAILLASLGQEANDSLTSKTIDEQGISGWAILSLTYYVALCGQEHVSLSLNLLKEMTKRLTAEFDIRFFLQRAPSETLAILTTWLTDENKHVRRLISEGTRPRLPWGMQLTQFIEDPSPVLILLEALKDDKEEYVRRSVANNLNDIAKDHPELVVKVAKNWLVGASPARIKLIKHACRSLIKNGHQGALAVLGYQEVKLANIVFSLSTEQLIFGDALTMTLSLNSISALPQPLIIDYAVHHQKANGKTSAKVFKWKTFTLAGQENLKITKKHLIKAITTRVYYPGLHQIDVLINGKVVAQAEFNLVIPA